MWIWISGIYGPGLRRHPDALLPLGVWPWSHNLVRAGHLSPLRTVAGDSGQLLLHQVRFVCIKNKYYFLFSIYFSFIWYSTLKIHGKKLRETRIWLSFQGEILATFTWDLDSNSFFSECWMPESPTSGASASCTASWPSPWGSPASSSSSSSPPARSRSER